MRNVSLKNNEKCKMYNSAGLIFFQIKYNNKNYDVGAVTTPMSIKTMWAKCSDNYIAGNFLVITSKLTLLGEI